MDPFSHESSCVVCTSQPEASFKWCCCVPNTTHVLASSGTKTRRPRAPRICKPIIQSTFSTSSPTSVSPSDTCVAIWVRSIRVHVGQNANRSLCSLTQKNQKRCNENPRQALLLNETAWKETLLLTCIFLHPLYTIIIRKMDTPRKGAVLRHPTFLPIATWQWHLPTSSASPSNTPMHFSLLLHRKFTRPCTQSSNLHVATLRHLPRRENPQPCHTRSSLSTNTESTICSLVR